MSSTARVLFSSASTMMAVEPGCRLSETDFDEVLVKRSGDGVSRQPAGCPKGGAEGRARCAGEQADQRATDRADSRADRRTAFVLDERHVAQIVLRDHHAGLQLEVGQLSVLEVLDGARGVVSGILGIERSDDQTIRHGKFSLVQNGRCRAKCLRVGQLHRHVREKAQRRFAVGERQTAAPRLKN